MGGSCPPQVTGIWLIFFKLRFREETGMAENFGSVFIKKDLDRDGPDAEQIPIFIVKRFQLVFGDRGGLHLLAMV
jgi:hypothetical protein